MSSRDYKIFRPGYYYHVYNRGDNRESIYLDDQDFVNFLKRLKIVLGLTPNPNDGRRGALRIRSLAKDSFTILAYCLLPNHFHILIRQNTEVPIGLLINKVSTSYAKYFNHKYKRIGNLFQDTFKAKMVDSDSYLTYLSAYIHNNPFEPFTYQYSSLPDYLGVRPGTLCDTQIVLKYFGNSREKYKKFVSGYTEEQSAVINDLKFDE